MKKFFPSCIEEIASKYSGYDIRLQALISTLSVEILRTWRKNDFDTSNIPLMAYNKDSLHTNIAIYEILLK